MSEAAERLGVFQAIVFSSLWKDERDGCFLTWPNFSNSQDVSVPTAPPLHIIDYTFDFDVLFINFARPTPIWIHTFSVWCNKTSEKSFVKRKKTKYWMPGFRVNFSEMMLQNNGFEMLLHISAKQYHMWWHHIFLTPLFINCNLCAFTRL